MTCIDRWCPQCKDRMVHQNNRGQHEAASGLLQWIHDELGTSMFIIDDDLNPDRFSIIRKMTDPWLWRYIEHKPVKSQLSDGQRFTLPRIAAMMARDIQERRLHRASGVFTARTDPPYDHGIITQILPDGTFGPPIALTGKDWRRFWLAQDIERDDLWLAGGVSELTHPYWAESED